MDISGTAAELEIDEEEYRSLLRLFTRTAANELVQIELAIRSADCVEVAHIAHSLKGASASLGLTEFFAIAESLDAAARTRVLSGADASIALLKREIDQISESIIVGGS